MSIIKGTNQIVAGFGGTKRSIGEVYFSQSALATDNSGALPLFTGETIASANTIYPEFYNWVTSHTELQCTFAEYESSLTTYGECAKYATKSQTTSYEWNGATSSMAVSGVYTKSATPAIGDIIYNDEACSTPSAGNDGVARTVLTIVSTDPYTFTADFGFQDEQGNPRFTLVTSHNVTITDGSIRLPLIKNYIKAANTAEGIKNIEAGLPNITGIATKTDIQPSGCFERDASAQYAGGASANGYKIKLDASRSSSIYGKSSTVTPASTTLYPWVVAYTAAIPASTAQAAEFQQGLSGKTDTNLGNTTPSQSFKEMSVGWGMPDYSAGVSVANSTIVSGFTAPCDGVFMFDAGIYKAKINGIAIVAGYYYTANKDAYGQPVSMFLSKGDVLKANNVYNTTDHSVFYPLKGVN